MNARIKIIALDKKVPENICKPMKKNAHKLQRNKYM